MSIEEDEKDCYLCKKGFPIVGTNHIPTQALGMIPVTPCLVKLREKDICEFKKWDKAKHPYTSFCESKDREESWLASRRTLREKIKADLSIGKLEVEDWPESPDY
jgi:hypothetical protein